MQLVARREGSAPEVVRATAILDHTVAVATQADRWVVACGGYEVPVLRNGRWYVYMYNPATREHGWWDIDTDIVETD